jgi:hypothetical protein
LLYLKERTYTIVTNKKAKAKRIIGCYIAGTRQNNRASQQINLKDRQAVIEITLDMANYEINS